VAKVLRPIGHEERLSVVDHLDELRSRLIVCLVALAVAFGICFWQNVPLIHLLNRALPNELAVSGDRGLGSVPNQQAYERAGIQQMERGARSLATAPGLSPAARAAAAQIALGASRAARALNRSVQNQEKPITIGVGEPFTTTLTVAAYFALLFTLPVLLFEAYGFVLPALSPNERRTAVPVMVTAR